MRPAHFLGGLLGIATFAFPVCAQPFAYETRTIVSPEVEVRCGASLSPSFYATTKLHRGDVVEVAVNRQTEPGWLAIKPPRGSFSWIRCRLVRQDSPNGGTVVIDGAPVLAGSSLTPKPPSVRTGVLQRGAQVVILDKPLVCSDGSKWLQIVPHPTEVRYIPVSAASPTSALQTVAAKPVGAAAGNVQLGSPTAATAPYGASTAPSAAPNGQYGQAPAVGAPQWTQDVGWLRKSNFKNDDGSPVYWYYNRSNQFVHYVVAQPGVNLDQYLSRWIYLYGQTNYRDYSGVRANFMTVAQVNVAK